MLSQLKYTFNLNNKEEQEILMAELIEIGFNGFEEKENKLLAYIEKDDCDEDKLNELLYHRNIKFSKSIVEEKNWNKEWESNFQPVIVDGKVVIRAHFHKPCNNILYDIVVTPKMSFGTGHHATTYMMVEQLLDLNIKNKTVFDFGTGTGLLAILAEKLGAKRVTAIDNDEWSISNASENIQQNFCNNIELLFSGHVPAATKFDIVLANINKNIIKDKLENLYHTLKPNSFLVLSGLIKSDEAEMKNLALKYHLNHIKTQNRDNWILLLLKR